MPGCCSADSNIHKVGRIEGGPIRIAINYYSQLKDFGAMIIVPIFIGTFVGSGIEFVCIPLYGAFKSVFYFTIPLGIFCAISFARGDYEQEGIESQIASGTIVGSRLHNKSIK